MRVIIYLPHFPLDLGSEDSIVLLITSAHSYFHTLTLRCGYPSSLLEYAGRIPGGPPLSLVLGERSEKRGRWSGIAAKKRKAVKKEEHEG